MKLSKRTTVVVMLVLCTALFASTAAFAAEEIRIGALFPLTGPAAVSGQNCVNSVLAAADVINKKNPDIKAPSRGPSGQTRRRQIGGRTSLQSGEGLRDNRML